MEEGGEIQVGERNERGVVLGREKWEEMQVVWKGDRVVGTCMEEL